MLTNESPYFQLQCFIEDRDILSIEKFIESNIDLNLPYMGDDQTALALACELGFVDVARLLVTCGADLDARMSMDGYTAIFWAIRGNQIEAVKFLVESGASIEVESYQGESLIEFTYGDDSEELTEIREYLLA
jgi:ankyrin repeat protein